MAKREFRRITLPTQAIELGGDRSIIDPTAKVLGRLSALVSCLQPARLDLKQEIASFQIFSLVGGLYSGSGAQTCHPTDASNEQFVPARSVEYFVKHW